MLNITKATRSERWVEYGNDEKYLIRFTPTFEGLRDFFDLAKEIIVDWQGVVGADEKPIPCNNDILAEFVRSDEGVERLKFLMQQASTHNGFTRIEELLKNSIAPSSGASTSPVVPPNGASNASASAGQTNLVKTAH